MATVTAPAIISEDRSAVDHQFADTSVVERIGNVVEITTEPYPLEKGPVCIQTPVSSYRLMPTLKEVQVPEIQYEYVDNHVEVPVPYELPILAPRQVPVEQLVTRNIPKPIEVKTTQHYRMPRLKPKYYEVKVPIYVPTYVEVPVPSHFLALRESEKLPEVMRLGPVLPHISTCAVPDSSGKQSYSVLPKQKQTVAAAVMPCDSLTMADEAAAIVESGAAVGEKTGKVHMIQEETDSAVEMRRKNSADSEYGYNSVALVKGSYPSMELVTSNTITNSSGSRREEKQIEVDRQCTGATEEEEEHTEKQSTVSDIDSGADDGLLLEEPQHGMSGSHSKVPSSPAISIAASSLVHATA